MCRSGTTRDSESKPESEIMNRQGAKKARRIAQSEETAEMFIAGSVGISDSWRAGVMAVKVFPIGVDFAEKPTP